MSNLPQHIVLRVQELAAAATEPVDLNELAFRALIEAHGSADAALRYLIPGASRAARKALDADQDLPDDGGDGEQLSFFPDSRSWIIVHTPDDGDVVIPKDHQTLGDVETWARQRRSHHRVQATRFDRFVEHIDKYAEGVDPGRRWLDVRPELQRTKTNALNSGEVDAA